MLGYPVGAEKPKSTLHVYRNGTFKIDLPYGEMTGEWRMTKWEVRMTARTSGEKPPQGSEQVGDLPFSSDQKTLTSLKTHHKWTRISDSPYCRSGQVVRSAA